MKILRTIWSKIMILLTRLKWIRAKSYEGIMDLNNTKWEERSGAKEITLYQRIKISLPKMLINITLTYVFYFYPAVIHSIYLEIMDIMVCKRMSHWKLTLVYAKSPQHLKIGTK